LTFLYIKLSGEFLMIKRISLAIAVVALLAGCSSGVKLDDVPVEDKTQSTHHGCQWWCQFRQRRPKRRGGVRSGAVGSRCGRPGGREPLVYFDYDSYVIKPEFQSLIEAHARFIKSGANRKVMVEGHTDERGGREYNLALGQKRAEAVRRSLALLGVSDSQVEAVSFGKEKPAAKALAEEVHAKIVALNCLTVDARHVLPMKSQGWPLLLARSHGLCLSTGHAAAV
jgi:peptidoglycan-associated lipoprotein